MAKWVKLNSDEIEGYSTPDVGNEYTSKMLTCDEIAGVPCMNINEGVLAPHAKSDPPMTHEGTEIYYVVSCDKGAAAILDGEKVLLRTGDVIIIPGGTSHAVDNTACDKELVLLTFWPKAEMNDMFYRRVRDWGTSIRYKK